MDCLHAAEILAASHDGELLDAAVLAEARRHAAACPQCRALDLITRRIREIPSPAAPDELLVRLEALAADEAHRVRGAERDRTALDALARTPVPLARTARPWMPRLTTVASAAAVLLLAAAVGGVAWLNQGPGAANKGSEEAFTTLQYDEAPSAVPESDAGTNDTAMRSAEQPAPPYIVFSGGVYVAADVPMPADASPVGVVTTDLGTGASVSRNVLSADPDGPLFVEAAEGYQAFARVERTFGRARYVLVADYPITMYGAWPTFPADLPQPMNLDGSLAYARFGFDDLGVDVYLPQGGNVEDGFAIAPHTEPDDPAAGNPDWTWWVPLP